MALQWGRLTRGNLRFYEHGLQERGSSVCRHGLENSREKTSSRVTLAVLVCVTTCYARKRNKKFRGFWEQSGRLGAQACTAALLCVSKFRVMARASCRLHEPSFARFLHQVRPGPLLTTSASEHIAPHSLFSSLLPSLLRSGSDVDTDPRAGLLALHPIRAATQARRTAYVASRERVIALSVNHVKIENGTTAKKKKNPPNLSSLQRAPQEFRHRSLVQGAPVYPQIGEIFSRKKRQPQPQRLKTT